MIEHPLVVVEWIDAAEAVHGWHHMDELPHMNVFKCKSVGWVVAENDDMIMLAQSLGDITSEDNFQSSGFARIPKVAIKRRIGISKENILEAFFTNPGKFE